MNVGRWIVTVQICAEPLQAWSVPLPARGGS